MGFMEDTAEGSVAGVLHSDPEHQRVSVVETGQ